MNKKWNVFESYNIMGAEFDAHRSKDLLMEEKYLKRLQNYLKSHAEILDLGCGSGRPIAEYLLKQGFKVKGIDGSQKMVELAMKYVPEMNPEIQDMRRLSLTQKYDAIIMWHSSFHLEKSDQRELFSKLARFLNPGGVLMFTSGPGDGEAWGENYGENLYHSSLSHEEYRKILVQNGFEVLSLDVEDKSAGGATVWICRFL